MLSLGHIYECADRSSDFALTVEQRSCAGQKIGRAFLGPPNLKLQTPRLLACSRGAEQRMILILKPTALFIDLECSILNRGIVWP
jgi:hypothetical protein